MLTRLHDVFRADPEEYETIHGLLIRAAIAWIEADGKRPKVAPESLEAWIDREFSGYGMAVRRQEDPPIPGEPLMSMAIAKDLVRQAVGQTEPGGAFFIERGDETAWGDNVAEVVRRWYEEHREGWWYRFRGWHKWGADNFMIGLINEVHRVERDGP